MSLINDALRRANQAKKNRPADSDENVLQPVEPRKSKSNFVPPILFAFAIAVLFVAGWFFWRALQEKRMTKTVVAESAMTKSAVVAEPSTPPPISAPVKPEPVVIAPEIVSSNSAPTNIAENIADAPTTNVVAATNAVPMPPAPPVLKLQGIFFRVANPTALINGKSVQVGDIISGARVTKITRSEVTVEWKDKTIVLELP